MSKTAFLIAAPSSGAGKTTITLGLLRALHNRGMNVQAFKSGPDYIDPKFHKLASEQVSVNLDMFFCDKDEIRSLFHNYTYDKDVAIVEGVMGLFDGYSQQNGSSAELAKTLNLPVVLVVNGKSVAYSMAALLYGYKNFDKTVNLAGVIFNNVSTESHYKILKNAASSVGLTSFGYITPNAEIEVPSRHLGLNIDEKYRFKEFADKLASHIQVNVNIDLLLETTKYVQNSTNFSHSKKRQASKLKIGIAEDEAFNFMYQENINRLKELGDVFFFSPINDTKLPKADYLYLPGGYPEFFLKELSKNKQMLADIQYFAENNGKIWAECGGMLYLCREMIAQDGISFPMANVLPLRGTLQNMKLKLGYRHFTYNGISLKGHEFHYSSLLANETQSVAQLYSARNTPVNTQMFRYKNVIAGYTHVYWKQSDDFLKIFE